MAIKKTVEAKPAAKKTTAKKVVEKVVAIKKTKTPNVAANGWPKIQQGTHLTVRTHKDGSTDLIWDDEQLLKEVREAIASVECKTPTPKKRAKKTQA